MKEIKKLPLNFIANGYKFKQLRRNPLYALYEGINKYGSICYEIHKVRIKEAGECKFKGSDGQFKVVAFQKSEILARNEEFGLYGWSYSKEVNALIKYEELVKA